MIALFHSYRTLFAPLGNFEYISSKVLWGHRFYNARENAALLKKHLDVQFLLSFVTLTAFVIFWNVRLASYQPVKNATAHYFTHAFKNKKVPARVPGRVPAGPGRKKEKTLAWRAV